MTWRPDEVERKAIVEMGGSVLANVRKGADEDLVRWAREEGLFVYIGARSPWRPDLTGPWPWANPYRAKTEAERDRVCDLYADHLAGNPALHARLHELRGRVLGCWCSPARCHGGELLAALERDPG